MPCRVCKAIDHSELTCPTPFSSASSAKVLLRQIMARNPDYSYAEALGKVKNCGPGGTVKPSTAEEVEGRQKDDEPALKPAGQDLVETSNKPHVSSQDELFPSRRRSTPEGETAAQVQNPETGRHIQTDRHGGIVPSATDTVQQPRAPYLDRAVQADEASAQRRTAATASTDDPLQHNMASALKHFRNREEKRETDRASEAGSYHESEVVDPAVGDGTKAEIEDGDEEAVEGRRKGAVDGSDTLEENFPGGRKGWEKG